MSLLSTFSKRLEKCVYKRVYSFLEKNNLGFRSGYSSNHTIVNLVESIKKYIGILIMITMCAACL